MSFPFTKMQGLGNDFILVEEDRLPLNYDIAALARSICNRNYGIGSDGLVLIGAPEIENTDIKFRFYNPDGSEAEMCGNGIRCFARYVKEQRIIPKSEFNVDTKAGILRPRVNADNTVTVDMGPPRFESPDFPFVKTSDANSLCSQTITVNDKLLPVTMVSMGNPHCIILERNAPDWFDIREYGPIIETHPAFPHKTNVEWVSNIQRQAIHTTVWERGAAFTLACGTGACAAMVAASVHGLVDEKVTVTLPGGQLLIEWESARNVLMTGPAEYVFTGVFDEKGESIQLVSKIQALQNA